jgi:hypothetical protein
LYYHQLIDSNGRFTFAIRPDPDVTVLEGNFGEDSMTIAKIHVYIKTGHKELRFHINHVGRIATILKDGFRLPQHTWTSDSTNQVVTIEAEWSGRSTLEFQGKTDVRLCEISSFTATSIKDIVVLSWTIDSSSCSGVSFHIFRSSEPNTQYTEIGSEIHGQPSFAFLDTDIEMGRKYSYVIQVIHEHVVQVYGPVSVTVGPESYNLLQNYPNPFKARTYIPFLSTGREEIRIEIYDILGRKSRSLYSGKAPPGRLGVTWEGRGDGREELSSGVYFCKLTTQDHIFSKGIVLLR